MKKFFDSEDMAHVINIITSRKRLKQHRDYYHLKKFPSVGSLVKDELSGRKGLVVLRVDCHEPKYTIICMKDIKTGEVFCPPAVNEINGYCC